MCSCQLCLQHGAGQEGWGAWLPADSLQLPQPGIGALPATGSAARLGHGHAALTSPFNSHRFSKSGEDPGYPQWTLAGAGTLYYTVGGQCHGAAEEQTW